MRIVDARRATGGYDRRLALHGVDLSVESGEVVALLGGNGSGKSTLVKAVLGLVPLAAGAVRLFDTPLDRFRQWRRVGYVPQRMGAAGGVPATVTEVVNAGRLAHRRIPMPMRRRDQRIVAEALEAVDLADRAADAVSTLSGGQQQRVLIARALAAEPDLFVLDEPTAGVDAASQELLADLLAERVRTGAAVLLVAHELGPLAEVADRAVVLSHGRVVHDGAVPHTGDAGGEHVHAAEPQPGMWSAA